MNNDQILQLIGSQTIQITQLQLQIQQLQEKLKQLTPKEETNGKLAD